MSAAGIDLATDDFNRANGAMGSTPVGGAPWQALRGTWTINSNYAYPGGATTTNDLTVIDMGRSDVDISISMSNQGGDAIYFRVVDANNWLRLRYYYYVNQGSYPIYCNSYTWIKTCELSLSPDCGSQGGTTRQVSNCGSCGGNCPQYAGEAGGTCSSSQIGCSQSGSVCGSYQCDTGYTYDYYSLFYFDKCVNGTVSAVTNSSTMGGSSGLMRVRALGSTIQGYRDGSGSAMFTVTNSDFLTATKHGIGRSSSALSGTQIDNFSATAI